MFLMIHMLFILITRLPWPKPTIDSGAELATEAVIELEGVVGSAGVEMEMEMGEGRGEFCWRPWMLLLRRIQAVRLSIVRPFLLIFTPFLSLPIGRQEILDCVLSVILIFARKLLDSDIISHSIILNLHQGSKYSTTNISLANMEELEACVAGCMN
jgi:hypothetical protein